MRPKAFLVLLIFNLSCIDRITFDVNTPKAFPVVIDGYISDAPGPYTIKVSKAFDTESKVSIRTPISVKKLILSDDYGNFEELVEVETGRYQTNPAGLRGTVGRSYTLRIELLDGRIYVSEPETIMPGGNIESVYYQFIERTSASGLVEYGFDIFFNANSITDESKNFLWKYTTTFQYETNPELYTIKCGESECPRPLACSSYSIGQTGELEYVRPCECCTCWAQTYNSLPIISGDNILQKGSYNNVKAGFLPVNEWTFMHKSHILIEQFSLTPKAYKFWKAVYDQKKANGSLFEPQAGTVPSNFIQLQGVESPIEGVFFATSISSKGLFVTRNDVPRPGIIPSVQLPYRNTCTALFPNATINRPSFWTD
ncbi:MAG: DUF4249 domain-containing protein [Cyclobacteriaceae bacterium]|nr:DUF4249 domain-containing protein [Cyclobacteriaceae bacterium]